MDEKELEILIPSKDARNYAKKVNWTFTDVQKAALLVHGTLPLKEQYSHLQALQNSTADPKLQGQITEYLNRTDRELRAFKENSGKNHIYILKVEHEDISYTRMLPSGYFYDWEMACEYGRKEKLPFYIEKHLVGDIENLDKYEESEYYDYEIACLAFNEDGEADYFDSQEISYDKENGETDFYESFQTAFYEVPNPFERGDIVKIIETEEYGIVDTSQKDWKESLARYKTPEWMQMRIGPDCSDVQIRVEFLNDDGTFSHRHINPIHLEWYRFKEDWQNGSPRDKLLMYARLIYKGEGSLDELYFFTMDYRKTKEE